MRLPARAALLLLALLPGCLGGPRFALQDVFQHSDASWADGHYDVHVRGRLVSAAAQPTRGVAVLAGVGADCLTPPPYPGSQDLGDLAAGTSATVDFAFEQEAPRYATPRLWWRVTVLGATADRDCGPLAVG